MPVGWLTGGQVQQKHGTGAPFQSMRMIPSTAAISLSKLPACQKQRSRSKIRGLRGVLFACDHSLSNIHLVDDGRVLDWCANRAATDAADAVRHDNAADMICFGAIDLTSHLILCKIDLLGGEDVVSVLAVVAAI